MPATNCITDELVTTLFSELFDLDVDAKRQEAPTSTEKVFVAKYGSKEDPNQAICICDLAFANKSGAALAMVPPACAKEGIAKGECPENLRENFSEVMNLCSNLFPAQQSADFRLQEIHDPSAETTELATAAIADEATESVTLQLSVKKYGDCEITLVARPQ